MRWTASLLVAAATIVALAQSDGIQEASGVVRLGSSLLVVDDSEVGAYYRVPVKGPMPPVIDLSQARVDRIELRQKGLGIDLESIGVLADSRIVLLSERLRSLVSDQGIVAEYDSELAEVAKRGLEGLAIRPLPSGASRVAVMWEGGYGDFGPTGSRLQRPTGRGPWLPLIVIHDVPRLGRVGRVRLTDAVATIELQVPLPAGNEPEAQRFRAPDLCWTRLPGGDWGFIVLLSSQNGLPKPTFAHHWIQRFNLEGQRVGEPLDLAAMVPKELAGANWEGLNWWEPGRSLVLVHESNSRLPAHAALIELPADWRYAP